MVLIIDQFSVISDVIREQGGSYQSLSVIRDVMRGHGDSQLAKKSRSMLASGGLKGNLRVACCLGVLGLGVPGGVLLYQGVVGSSSSEGVKCLYGSFQSAYILVKSDLNFSRFDQFGKKYPRHFSGMGRAVPHPAARGRKIITGAGSAGTSKM